MDFVWRGVAVLAQGYSVHNKVLSIYLVSLKYTYIKPSLQRENNFDIKCTSLLFFGVTYVCIVLSLVRVAFACTAASRNCTVYYRSLTF